jgi:formylglycine-generating enzyme required for sulfatase activity
VVWLLSLPVLVLALVAWFLLTARSVEIVVEPEPDRLEFRAGLSRLGISLGGRHLVRPGTYTLRAAKEGYRDLEQTVVVTRESSQSYTFSLRKLPGLLVVDVGGIRGARISIDGEEVARTPATALELEPGEHDLQITSERHRPFATRVAVEGGGATQTLTAELVPRWAPVAFSTRPSGATIRANGEDVGLTPATVDLIEGTYSIELALAGHRTHRRRIEVVAGEPLTLPAVALEPADGRLVLHSDPTGATVTVDGVFRGTTPLDVPLEPGRPHEVELRKPGYETRTTSVTVRSGRTAEEEVTLPALLGEVDVRATPADAELIVDGTSRGDANRTLRLVAVPHEIEVRKEGYESYSTTVTPRPGLPQRLEVTLRSTEKIRAEATPPRIRTSQGRELVLVQGGRLRMGASRREPGRRSNETLREVELTRPFYIATREVSNAEFREFREDHSSGKAGGVSLEVDHHPVVRVTWEDAARYCNWLSAKEGLPLAYEMRGGAIRLVQPATTGYRLPTEAEWAFAARYGGGTTRLKYAWGDSLPPPAGSGNFGDRSAAGLLPDVIDGYDDGWPGTAPVGSFAPNALGLFNLGGNVAEWVHDRYTVYTPSRAGEVEHDPLGPVDGDGHVIRGAGWMDAVLSDLRLSFRDHGSGSRPDVGFRIARYAE